MATRSALVTAISLLVALASAAPAAGQIVIPCAVADEFNSVSYANQDGTLSWSGDWIEVDGGGGGPASGRASISGGELSLHDFPNTDLDTSVERQVDLSGRSSARFEFDFRTTSGVDANDVVFVEVSNNGGASWTLLESITGIAGATSASRSYDIAAFIAPNTRVRLRIDGRNGTGGTVCCYGASNEAFVVDRLEIITSGNCTPEHYALRHDGSAQTCGVEPIQVSRHDPLHAVDTGTTATFTISTSTGNGSWTLVSGAGLFSDLGGGQANYSFAPADAGQVVLGLANSVPETVNFSVVEGSVTELPGEAPALPFVGGGTSTFRDDFATTSYNNNDGTQSWAGPWIEINESDGPAAGDERIFSSVLRVRDNDGGGEGVMREADLSAFTSATLHLTYLRRGLDNAADFLTIDVSDDGGATWTEVDRFAGPAHDPTFLTASYDISAFLSAQTRIRFLTSPTMGPFDQVFFADVEIEAAAAVNCGPDHFAIVHDGSGVNCQAEPVTIVAHDASHNVDTSFSDAISLSTTTNHGDWSLVNGAGTFTNLGNGGATYQFDLADNGQVDLALRNTYVESLSIDVSGSSTSENVAEDPGLAFDAAGFQFLADGVPGNLASQIAAKPTDLAPNAQALELQAIRTSPVTGACEAALQGSEPVDFAIRCLDPTLCSGATLELNGVSIAPTSGAAALLYTGVNLDFGDASDTTAPIVWRFFDVGQIQLHARRTLSPSGESLLGASAPVVVRPFGFELAVPGNPGALDGSGAVFGVAGTPFALTARALQWQAADDANGDGAPDGHTDTNPANNADLSDNPTAPSFGREALPESASLSADLWAPAGANNPGLAGTTLLGPWSAGQTTVNDLVFDEVGVIEIAAAVADNDYLGIGPGATFPATSRSGPVGRFRPDRLEVSLDTAPRFATGCSAGSFTYVGQPFGYDVEPVLAVIARSASGAPTLNYRADFFKLDNASLPAPVYSANPGAPPFDLSGLPPPATNPTILDLGNGTGTLRYGSGSGLRFDRGTPLAVFDADLALDVVAVDSDGVNDPTAPFAIGATTPGNGIAWSAGASQRFGRLALQNAFGTELSPLPEPLRAEFFTGSGFAAHGDDGCTVVNAANIGTSARSPGLATNPSVANAPLLSGDAGLVWSAPGGPGFADVFVNLGNTPIATPWGAVPGADLPWLTWDWSGDGSGPPLENPVGRLEFGIFSGSAPVIFQREIY